MSDNKIKLISDMSFDDQYQLLETLNMLYPRLIPIMDELKSLDCETILGAPEMTKLAIYKKGFNALPRLIEELAREVKYNNNHK